MENLTKSHSVIPEKKLDRTIRVSEAAANAIIKSVLLVKL